MRQAKGCINTREMDGSLKNEILGDEKAGASAIF